MSEFPISDDYDMQRTLEFDYEGSIAESYEARRVAAEKEAADRIAHLERQQETQQITDALPTFFEAVDGIEDAEAKHRQVDRVVSHLLRTDNAFLIARHFDLFASRADQITLATRLINSGKFGIVSEHLYAFDDPKSIRALMPGLF